MFLGNDISTFQGQIDFPTLRNNANFVIIKSSEGVGFTDPQFTRNQSEARRVGFPVGYYHFARPDLGNDPAVEADFFLKVVGPLQGGEILCLDYEVTYHDPVGWCKLFLDRVKFMTQGYEPLIYLNQSLLKSFDWSLVSGANYGLWVAAYTYDPRENTFASGSWKFAAMQQWTDKQTVPGINGNVDGDVFFGDVDVFLKYGYHPAAPVPSPLPPPPVEPTPPPVPPSPPSPPPGVDYKQIVTDIETIIYDKSKIPWWNVFLADGRLTEIADLIRKETGTSSG